MPRLCVDPVHRTYDRSQADRLEADLESLDQSTQIEDIATPADLTMADDGRLGGGYRFTSTGLRQVCNLACPGLYQAITDLAGDTRDAGAPREEYSFELARQTYNKVIAIRFDRLADCQRLLRNVTLRTVDGVLGPRYAPLSNRAVYANACEAAESNPRPSAFFSASLAGRLLVVRFVRAATLFAVPWTGRPGGDTAADEYQEGLHFTNSEVGGESTIRAAAILRRRCAGTTSMGRFLGGRRLHTGRHLGAKVRVVFAEAAQATPDPDRLRGLMVGLADQGLGLDGGEEARTARVEALTVRLHDAGVTRRLAERAVLAALHCGAVGHGDAMPQPLGRAALASRTAFDLYIALTAQAAALYGTAQESVEQAAHQVLLGRIKLK